MSYVPNPYLTADIDTLKNISDVAFRPEGKKRQGRKGAKKPSPNRRLDPSVHDRIIADLLKALEADGSYAANYLAETLLSKYVGPETDSAEVREARAIDKWLATERRNAVTNMRIHLDPDEGTDFGWCTSSQLLDFASKLIRRIIGVTPPQDILYGTFSGGASTSKRRQAGVIQRKFAYQADVTEEAWNSLRSYFNEELVVWRNLVYGEGFEPRIVDCNVMFTVPKSSTIDRVACKEPDLNVFAQKGVGDFFRRRLLSRAGIDLNDQSVNRGLALEGSKDGSLATLDLSSASDSVCTQLVYRLLPAEWAVLLETLRSQRTQLPDGSIHYNEMLSSMGNGFTFELESLLFYSLVRAVCYYSGVKGRVSVYGDDIICPSSVAARVARTFRWFGFQVNPEKSFWRGRFRESCGGHYYRGVDVTPFYVKEPIDTVERLIHFLNRLRKWVGTGFTRTGYFELWQKYSAIVPKHLHGGWNVESPYALVSTDMIYRPRRLDPLFVETIPGPTVMGVKPRRPKGGWRDIAEYDGLQLGAYLYALRTIDGRTPRWTILNIGEDTGEWFWQHPYDSISVTPETLRGWRTVENPRPSWHSGQVPCFPEEYGASDDLT